MVTHFAGLAALGTRGSVPNAVWEGLVLLISPPAPMTGERAPGAPSPQAIASHSFARRLMPPSQTTSAQGAP